MIRIGCPSIELRNVLLLLNHNIHDQDAKQKGSAEMPLISKFVCEQHNSPTISINGVKRIDCLCFCAALSSKKHKRKPIQNIERETLVQTVHTSYVAETQCL